jgi:phosphoenolpyruvate carboxykinase (ATP)
MSHPNTLRNASVPQLLGNSTKYRKNSSAEELLVIAQERGEGRLASNGAFAAFTGDHTGRSPKDKFIVKDEETRGTVDWGTVNQPMEPDVFDALANRFIHYLKGKEFFVQHLYACAEPEYQLRIQLISELAWHALFAKQVFIRAPAEDRDSVAFTILMAPGFEADPARDGVRSKVVVAVNFRRRLILIGGTRYAGEIKKSIFTVLNYILPARDVLPMHCSANSVTDGDTALFFGLSGTGKTTLSADSKRRLIGDDEHGWGHAGIFNFEGGCYAKCIRLSQEHEPQIWAAIRRGAVLENVVLDKNTAIPAYEDDSITENTRAAYPLDFIANAVIPSIGKHPKNIFFLTADAFGVLPPISRLKPHQALYHFLSGYTAKVAGTETGLEREPRATFSTCFGAPFLPLPASAYADMLRDRIHRHLCECWLVNTGWIGGQCGVGHRIPLRYTRALVHAVLHGLSDATNFAPEPLFGLSIPQCCPDVPPELLHPRQNWSSGEAYDEAGRLLAARFHENAVSSGIQSSLWDGGPILTTT